MHFFDRLEDHVRKKLSRLPLIYAFIGGVGVVLFWRGVWHSADFITHYFSATISINVYDTPWWDGPVSLLVGTLILLITGVFISNFIGNEIIISGIKGEKKIVEKTESEIKNESEDLQYIRQKIDRISAFIAHNENMKK